MTQGIRYWFTTEEQKAIQLFNKQYEAEMEINDMIQCLYRTSDGDEQTTPINPQKVTTG